MVDHNCRTLEVLISAWRRGGATGMAELYCRHGCVICMLWLPAEEEEVGKEGRSANNLKQTLHNSDVTVLLVRIGINLLYRDKILNYC